MQVLRYGLELTAATVGLPGRVGAGGGGQLFDLYLLGVHLPWTTVGALEVSASFLRNVAFVVPAGLGVQDLSYLAFLRALNVADAVNVAAAFLLLKRSKECFWAVCGYAILAVDLRPLPAPKPIEQAC